MKKLLGLLSVLTISGSAVPTTIAASPYQKEEIKLENNLENLQRYKRQKNDVFSLLHSSTEENLQNLVIFTNFNLGNNASDEQILDNFININNIPNSLADLLYISSRIGNAAVRISVRNNNMGFTGQVVVNYTTGVNPSTLRNRRININSLIRDLGTFRNLRRRITNEVIINRFLEVNRLPQNLNRHFQIIGSGDNWASISIRNSFTINNSFYSYGQSTIVNYIVDIIHDEL